MSELLNDPQQPVLDASLAPKAPETRIETYIPLYRKYRPQAFADVVGQEAIVQTLGNAINLNKVAHAYLFCGPRGTGKTSTARIFAKSLNCEQGPTVTPCQVCASCTGITEGNALDVIEFDAASNNGVSDARELIENCQYTSMTGRFKIYIIDEVHMLTPAAFNALLKTLEEPPPNVIFIFATTEAHKVLPTIISRCQRFDFNRITNEDISARLHYIAGVESINIDDEALMMIARHARGGMRDAVGLLDQVSVLGRAQADKVIGRKDVALFIGTLEEDILLKLGAAIAERRAADLLTELAELVNRGIEPVQLLKDLTVHFRNLLLVKASGAGANADLLSLPADYFESLKAQAGLFPEDEELPQIIARLSFVERNIRNTQQPQLWLEVGLIELAYRHEIFLLKSLSERVAQLEAQLAGGAAPMPARPQAQPPSRPAAPQYQPPPPPVQQAPPVQPAQPPAPADRPMTKPGFVVPGREEAPPAPQPAAMSPEPMAAPAYAPPVPAAAPPSMPAQSSQPAQPAFFAGDGSLNAAYAAICNSVASPPVKARMKDFTFPLSQDEGRLVIGCINDAHLEALKKKDRFIHIQKAVDAYFGRPMQVDLILETSRPATSPPMANQPAMSAAAAAPAYSPPAPPPVQQAPAQSSPPVAMPDQGPPPAMEAPGSFRPSAINPVAQPVDPAEAPSSPAARRPAMDAVEERPLPSLKEAMAKAAAANQAGVGVPFPSPSDGEGPVQGQSMEFADAGPPDVDEGPMDEDFQGAGDALPPQAMPSPGLALGDDDLTEAKKYTLQILHGKVIE